MAKVTISFSLDDNEDADLVRWLDSLPKGRKSEVIREVLRQGRARAGLTLGDVYQAVKALEGKIQAGAVVSGCQSEGKGNEPPDAAAALDKLAELGG